MTKRYVRRAVGGVVPLSKTDVVKMAVRGTEKMIRKASESAANTGTQD